LATSEMRGFVFSLIFIIVFAGLLSSIPTGLQGAGETIEAIIPVDPNLLSGFSAAENYTREDIYEYKLPVADGRDWIFVSDADSMSLAAKVFTLGILWLGHLAGCRFVADGGTNRGPDLSLADVQTDSEDGAVKYSLIFTTSGESAGSFIVYWNTSEYANVVAAWAVDEVELLHGLGFDETATNNIGALIISLLLLQLPDVPVLINLLLATPIWACIVYVLWYVIKEMIPFV